MDAMESHTKAAKLATMWLQGEDAYQFGKSDGIFHDHAVRLGSIMDQEMPQRWRRYRVFRDNHVPDQASQQIMKLAGAARAAVVISECANGSAFDEAQQESWRCLEAFDPEEDAEGLRRAVGSRTLRQAFGDIEYTAENHLEVCKPGLIQTMGLAVAHLVVEEQRLGDMHVPMPGRPSGEVLEWRPDLSV